MIRSLIYLCLVLTIQASLVPQGYSDNPPSAVTIPGLQAIQQSILNTYLQNQGAINSTSNSSNLADQVPMPGGSIEAVRQKHNQLIDSYFRNKNASSAPTNIDQGSNNTINGVHNVIESGTANNVKGDKNILNGSKNRVDGSENNIKGDENIIKSDKNVVHGNGNVIMDGPVPPIDIKIQPITPKTESSGSSTNSKGSSVTGSSTTNLSSQFESYFALGILLIALQLLL